MAILKCTLAWMIVLVVYFDLGYVQSFPSLSFNITTCPRSVRDECYDFQQGSCQKDQDCEVRYPGKELKCCGNCGKRCVPSEVAIVKMTPVKLFHRLKPRTKLVAKCPTSPPSSKSPPGPDQECQNDANCDDKFPGQELKCCSDGDDFRCMVPVVEALVPTPPPVNETCPVFPKPPECPPEPDDECTNDQKCAELYPGLGMKCCKEGCDFVCLLPVAPS